MREKSICQICFSQRGVDEHHIYRGINRKHSPTVFLCRSCHEAITREEQWALYILDMVLKLRRVSGYSEIQA